MTLPVVDLVRTSVPGQGEKFNLIHLRHKKIQNLQAHFDVLNLAYLTINDT
jgi:hypothetical protein